MKNLIFILLLLGTIITRAQVEKISIGLMPVTSSDGKTYKEIVAITEELSNAFLKTKRFTLVEKSKMDIFAKDRNLNKTEEVIDENFIAQAKNLGAQYIITSTLNTYSNDDSICKFSLNLKLVDVSTSEVKASEIINTKSESERPIGFKPLEKVEMNPVIALQKALLGISLDFDAFIKDNFPVTFSLEEITAKVNGLAKMVLISGGIADGVKKGDKFKVVETSEILVDGEKTIQKNEIGQLLVINFESENVSLCVVITGGMDIITKKEAGKNLEVISIPN